MPSLAAVERYEVDHPVLDDPDLPRGSPTRCGRGRRSRSSTRRGTSSPSCPERATPTAWTCSSPSWSTEHERKGTLHRGDGPYVPPLPQPSTLRFPAKAVLLPTGHVLVADAGHHQLQLLEGDGETPARLPIGSGQRGLLDGPPDVARFDEPNGLCLLPPDVAAAVGYDVVVADTVNHALRGVSLIDGMVTTVAGTGSQWMQSGLHPPDGAAREQDLSSPWDVVWSAQAGVARVAMAGIHQLWDFDPVARRVRPYAGTTNEGLRDGPVDQAWFAQTSGLAVTTDQDGERLWLADSETSSLRSVRADVVMTHVGQGLFEFGHRDGPAEDALLQHPLGVTALPDGSVAVLDTYNDAVRRFDPRTGDVTTLATGLREPSGAVLVPGSQGVGRAARPARGRVRRAPAHPGTAPEGRGAGRPDRVPHQAPRPRRRTWRGRARGGVRAAAGAEARRQVRPLHPPAGVGVTAGAARVR